jgi:GT2 family glycosyltransferase
MVRREFPTVTLIESGGNLGFGRAHNLLARYSAEPFVLFLNPDTEFIEDAHEQMLEVFKRFPRVGVVGCRMTNLDGSLQPLGLQLHTSPWSEFVSGLLVSSMTMPLARRILPYHDPLVDGYVRKLYGGCLMVRRTVLDQVGWFDERFFMYGEDVDLSRRIEMAGRQLYYLSSTRIIHLCGGATAKAPGSFSILMQCESISKLMGKYYGRLGQRFYAFSIFIKAICRLTLIGLAWFPSRFSNLSIKRRFIASRSKQITLLRWSLGFSKPAIPK